MKRYFLICLVLYQVMLFAEDNVTSQVKELKKIKSEIQSMEDKIKQTDKKNQQKKAELTKTTQVKKITDEKVKVLSTKESAVRDSLLRLNQAVISTEEKMYHLDLLINRALQRLTAQQRNQQAVIVSPHRYLFKKLINTSADSLQILRDVHGRLEGQKNVTASNFQRVHATLSTEKVKSKTFEKKITTLNIEQTKLEKQKQEFLAKVAKLRQDASALESLIAKISQQQGKAQASYQFSSKTIAWPVSGKIVRDFGEEERSYGTSVVNNGIDIAVREGTPVKAVDSGDVIFSDRYGGQGKLVIIDHKNGFMSVYAYNSEILVNKGDTVKKGQLIAKSGMSGSATQPSLHFELRKDNRPVNPLNYLE